MRHLAGLLYTECWLEVKLERSKFTFVSGRKIDILIQMEKTHSNFRTFYVLAIQKYVWQFMYLAHCGKLYSRGLEVYIFLFLSVILHRRIVLKPPHFIYISCSMKFTQTKINLSLQFFIPPSLRYNFLLYIIIYFSSHSIPPPLFLSFHFQW